MDVEAVIEAIESLGLKVPAANSEPNLDSLAAGERGSGSILRRARNPGH